jgi:hypothetical protein
VVRTRRPPARLTFARDEDVEPFHSAEDDEDGSLYIEKEDEQEEKAQSTTDFSSPADA